MANTLNPPDGWIMAAGTWGTDAQRSDSVYLTSTSSLQLMTPNTTLYGSWIPMTSLQDTRYCAKVVLQGTSSFSSLTVNFVVYQASQSSSVASASAWSGAPTTLSTWLASSGTVTVPSTGYWGRFEIITGPSFAGNAYIDRVELIKLPPSFHLQAAGTTVVPNTWTTLACTAPFTFSINEVGFSAGSNYVQLFKAGKYQMNVRVSWPTTSFAAGNLVNVRLWESAQGVVPTGAGPYGAYVYAASLASDMFWSFIIDFSTIGTGANMGGKYQLQVQHNHAATNHTATADWSGFLIQ